MTVAGSFPGITCYLEGFTDTTSSNNDCWCFEENEVTGFADVTECSCSSIAIFNDFSNSGLSKYLDTSFCIAKLHCIFLLQRNDGLLHGADKFKTSAITHVSEAWIFVTTKVTLANFAFFGAIKERAPGF